MKSLREKVEDQIDILVKDNQRLYGELQDFTASYYRTENVMTAIAANNKIIKKLQKELFAGTVSGGGF